MANQGKKQEHAASPAPSNGRSGARSFWAKVLGILIGAPYTPPPALGRNELCWCGSGKKYKRCHAERDKKKVRDHKASQPTRTPNPFG